MSKRKALLIDQEYEVVDVKRIQEHPQNPRLGVVEAIEDSIDQNGWYGAVVVQKSTGYILAGNHRFRAAITQGAKEIPVIYRDVDDETAIRILLADNKTAELGGYDEDLLSELLSGLETLDGTGWGLTSVEESEESPEAGDGSEEVVPDDKYTPSFGVIVVCVDERHQELVYKELQEAGHQVRVVAV